MSEILEKIRSRGYWKVVIHPATFDDKRLRSLPMLVSILEQTSVQLKGWSFPHVESSSGISEGKDWVGKEIDWGGIIELWRFYQSGQFVHYSGMMTDWKSHTGMFSGDQSQSSDTGQRQVLLDLKEVMLRFAEIFDFASRLSRTEAGEKQMHISVSICGIQDYQFRVSSMDFFRSMESPESGISFDFDLHRSELIENARELALKPAAELFQRFGWTPPKSMLRDIQGELLSPSLPRAGWV